MTENFVVVPETSYMYDPCSHDINYDPEKAGWEQEYRYEDQVEGLVTVMNKTNGTDIHQVKSWKFVNKSFFGRFGIEGGFVVDIFSDPGATHDDHTHSWCI